MPISSLRLLQPQTIFLTQRIIFPPPNKAHLTTTAHSPLALSLSMESVGSNSPPLSSRLSPRTSTRLARALNERLRLLHRSGATFHVLGATANVYAVTLASTPFCSCPDPITPCKHILFVLLRVLSLPLSHPALRRLFLHRRLLTRLLATHTAQATLAGAITRHRFHQLFFASAGGGREGSAWGPCPVCLEEMGKEEGMATCSTCGNSLHAECWARWKRSRGRRAASCVMCRARWRERKSGRRGERYVNLSAYVREEEEVVNAGSGCADRNSCASAS